MKKYILTSIIFSLLVLTIVGCGSNNSNEVEESSKYNKYETIQPNNGKIIIDKNKLSKEATFINYDSNGTTIQLIAGIASDGTYRVSLNTCQSCNPSPLAYFVEDNGNLICQNCGNSFSMDDVGVNAIGCNPTNIEVEEDSNSITIDTKILDNYSSMFSNWEGKLK